MLTVGDLKYSFELRDREITDREEICRKDREELARDRQAYERIMALLESSKNSEILSITAASENSAKHGTLKRLVSEAVAGMGALGGAFSIKDVVALIMGMPDDRRGAFDINKNKPNVSAYLGEFVESGMLEVVERGSGPRPTTYKLKESTALDFDPDIHEDVSL